MTRIEKQETTFLEENKRMNIKITLGPNSTWVRVRLTLGQVAPAPAIRFSSFRKVFLKRLQLLKTCNKLVNISKRISQRVSLEKPSLTHPTF